MIFKNYILSHYCYCFWYEQAFSHNTDEFTQKMKLDCNKMYKKKLHFWVSLNWDRWVIIAIKLQRSVKRNTADYTNSSLTFLTLLFTLTATKCSSGTVLSCVSAVGVCVVVCGLKLCCFESLNGSPGPYWVLPPSHRSPLRSRLRPRWAPRRASPYCCRPFLQHTPLKHKAG